MFTIISIIVITIVMVALICVMVVCWNESMRALLDRRPYWHWDLILYVSTAALFALMYYLAH